MRVAKETHVEHQIGIAGQAARKTEGQYGERRLRHLAQAEAAADFLLQGVARQACRVDHMFGPATERLQQLAFEGDSVGGWTILRKGVAAARFGIAPLQLRARRGDKERGDIIAFARAQFLYAPGGASGIKPDRQSLVLGKRG